jgi:hypothetical protein
MYVAPLGEVISAHGCKYTCYADDTQVYLTVNKSDISSTLETLCKCVEDISSWMCANKLQLNEGKTEVIHLTSKHRPASEISSIRICDVEIVLSTTVKNLGVIFDKHLTMDAHVKNVTRTASFAIHNIGRIRQYLDKASTEKLIHAFVTFCCTACLTICCAIYNVSRTLQPDWSRDLGSLIASHQISYHYTGCQSACGLCLRYYWQPTRHWMDWHQPIYLHYLSHTNLLGIFAAWAPEHSFLQELKPSRMGNVLSRLQHHCYGIHFPRIFSAVSHSLLLNQTWKQFCLGRLTPDIIYHNDKLD